MLSDWLSDQLEEPTAARPRVVERSVVFTDVVGSTAFIDQLGDLCWLEVITCHHRHAHRLADDLQADRIQSTGDGVLVIFKTADAALAFSQEMIGSFAIGLPLTDRYEVELHVGMASGPVHEWNDDYFGRTMHLAARLSGLASPGEVLIDQASVNALTPTPIAKEKRVQVRGLSRVQAVFSIHSDAKDTELKRRLHSPLDAKAEPCPGVVTPIGADCAEGRRSVRRGKPTYQTGMSQNAMSQTGMSHNRMRSAFGVRR